MIFTVNSSAWIPCGVKMLFICGCTVPQQTEARRRSAGFDVQSKF
ncbi:hypothetical protein AAZX31_01G156800 [Glycine max]